MGRSAGALVVLAIVAGGVACALPRSGTGAASEDGGTPDGGGVPHDATADVSPGDDASTADVASDAEPDAVVVDGVAPPSDASTGTVTIANVGTVSNATGLASGTHLVYATHAKLWWLFWFDSTQSQTIQTSYSPDFVTWSPGGSLPLKLDMQGQGGNLSVAYADVQGADVVHLSIGAFAANDPTRHHLHARAVISGTTITFGSVADLSDVTNASDVDPDGPATFVDSQGTVWDATGWSNAPGGVGNEAIAASTGAEQGGTAWDGAFGAQVEVYSAQGYVHSRAFATAGANLLVALCDSADVPSPTNVEWVTWGGAMWSGPLAVFAGGKPQDPNDWGVATLATSGHMHVVRRTTAGTFDAAWYDGMNWTTMPAAPPDTLGGATGQGLVVLASGPRIALVTIAADLPNTVRMLVWDQTKWEQWTTLEGSTASRGWVSGWSGPKNDAVIWTEADGSGGYRIMGRVVSF